MACDMPLWLAYKLLDSVGPVYRKPRTTEISNRYVQWLVDLGLVEPFTKGLAWNADDLDKDDPNRIADVTRRTSFGEFVYRYIENHQWDEENTQWKDMSNVNWEAPVSVLDEVFTLLNGMGCLPDEYNDIPEGFCD